MTVTELPNGKIEKRHKYEELRFIFFGPVVKKAYDYFEYFDFTGANQKLTLEEYAESQRDSAEAPVRVTECRFLYQNRFFKTAADTTDTDLILGAIIEKDRRKVAREKKLKEVGRNARTKP